LGTSRKFQGDRLPELLTVVEAARLIRVGRTKAYEMATEWRVTDGRSGLPVIDLGNALRVPLQELERVFGTKFDDRNPSRPQHESGRRRARTATTPSPEADPRPNRDARNGRPTNGRPPSGSARRNRQNAETAPTQLNRFNAETRSS